MLEQKERPKLTHLTGLWWKKGADGREFLVGTTEGVRYLVLPTRGEKPAFRLFVEEGGKRG